MESKMNKRMKIYKEKKNKMNKNKIRINKMKNNNKKNKNYYKNRLRMMIYDLKIFKY